jgi:hypothetical protein
MLLRVNRSAGILQVALAAMLGCSKPSADKQHFDRSTPNPLAHASPGDPRPSPRKFSGLESDYLAAQEFETRVGLIYKIARGKPNEAAEALDRLFLLENDPELKALILSALGDVEGEIEVKLRVLRKALTIEQAPDVRHAAAAEMEWLDDRRTLPLWQQLTADPDPQIRDLATDMTARWSAAKPKK